MTTNTTPYPSRNAHSQDMKFYERLNESHASSTPGTTYRNLGYKEASSQCDSFHGVTSVGDSVITRCMHGEGSESFSSSEPER